MCRSAFTIRTWVLKTRKHRRALLLVLAAVLTELEKDLLIVVKKHIYRYRIRRGLHLDSCP